MQRDAELIAKLKQSGLLEDPHWLERLDEPAPLRVVMESLIRLDRKSVV